MPTHGDVKASASGLRLAILATVHTFRRRLTLGLIVAALTTVTVTILASVDGGEYVHLRPLAHPFLGIALAAGMLGVAAQLAVKRRALRVGSQLTATLVAAAALFTGVLAESLDDMFEASNESVVATAPDFTLVSYRSPGFFSSGYTVLRVQSREGIASREGRKDLACFIEASSGADHEWLFDRARFTGEDEITVFAKDGSMWQIRFDTQTLLPVNPLDRCTDAPDPARD